MTCQCVAFPTARSPSISPIFGRRFSVFAASLAVSQHRGTPCSIPSFCPRAENSSIAAKAWASISLTCCRSFSSAHPFFVFSSAATTLSKKVSSSDGFIKCSILLFLYPPRKRSGGCEYFFTYVFWSTVTPCIFTLIFFCFVPRSSAFFRACKSLRFLAQR